MTTEVLVAQIPERDIQMAGIAILNHQLALTGPTS